MKEGTTESLQEASDLPVYATQWSVFRDPREGEGSYMSLHPEVTFCESTTYEQRFSR